ncbi:hypothetical protein [Serinicoccus sp. LYQ131]|uniref:hypothetical protein n=1 Tax=Serinicoccus sp. LYQ131 TaxID=3378797 RepID=UPI0038535825
MDLVTPIRVATWQRVREGHPVLPGQLIGHADEGRQGGFNCFSQPPLDVEAFNRATTDWSKKSSDLREGPRRQWRAGGR